MGVSNYIMDSKSIVFHVLVEHILSMYLIILYSFVLKYCEVWVTFLYRRMRM